MRCISSTFSLAFSFRFQLLGTYQLSDTSFVNHQLYLYILFGTYLYALGPKMTKRQKNPKK